MLILNIVVFKKINYSVRNIWSPSHSTVPILNCIVLNLISHGELKQKNKQTKTMIMWLHKLNSLISSLSQNKSYYNIYENVTFKILWLKFNVSKYIHTKPG